MNKIALITGVTGQDGAYLAEFLLGKGYIVHGLVRRASLNNTGRIDHLYQGALKPDGGTMLHYVNLTDATHHIRIPQQVRSNEVLRTALPRTPTKVATNEPDRHQVV